MSEALVRSTLVTMNTSVSTKTHTCSEQCARKSRSSTTCFSCKKTFYTKCFSIDDTLKNKINAKDSMIRFVCGQCQSETIYKRSTQSTDSVCNANIPDTNQLNQLSALISTLIDKLSEDQPGNFLSNRESVKPYNSDSLADIPPWTTFIRF